MKIISLVLFSLVLAAAADLPQVAQAAIKKSQSVFDKIDAEALGKTNKEREALVVILTKSLDVTTKAGDLEGAVAIKKKIDEIKSDIKSSAPAVKEVAPPWWTKITVEQWDAIEGAVITVPATSAEFDTKVTVPSGQSFVIVPRPGDTWSTGVAWPMVGPDGDLTQIVSNAPVRTSPLMAMLISGKNQQVSKDPVVTGPLKIRLKSNDGSPADNVGEIRVKIVPVDQK